MQTEVVVLQEFAWARLTVAIIILAALAALILFVVRKARRPGAAIAVLVGPLVLIVLYLTLFRDVRRPATVVATATPVQRTTGEMTSLDANQKASQPPTAWKIEVDEQFLADTYATYEMAQRALGRHVKPLILEALRSQGTELEVFDDSHRIIIQNDEQKPIDGSVLDALQACLAQEFPDTAVLVAEDSYGKIEKQVDDENQKHFHVGVATHRSPSKPDWSESGEIAVEVRGQVGSWTAGIPYVNSSWVHSESVDDGYERVRTPDFASSREQAETVVRDLTVDALAEFFPRYPFTHRLPAKFDLRKELSQSLRDSDSVFADRFTQKLMMGSGDFVFRSAALIDKSRLEPMFAEIVEKHRPQHVSNKKIRRPRRKERSFWGGLTGLLLGVVGVVFGSRLITRRMTASRIFAGSHHKR